MKQLLLFLVLVLILVPAWAQNIAVTGRVLGGNGSAQPGVTVLQKGTTNGTSTDNDGSYRIQVPSDAVLVFSAIGSATQQINVNGRTSIDVRMQDATTDLNEVVITGSRASEGRSNILTTAPVDVISAREIKAFAQTEISQVLTYAAPSFQSSRQAISDGTDHVDPASLRGLGPDQVLVLVNGKRRHTSALVNINGTVGRGSVGTDLNVIPLASIKRIEVLREGAAAQYGSDAIAGVINIQLKDDSTGVTASATGGQHYEGDGAVFQADANVGIGLGGRGFLDVSGQFLNRGYTNRTFEDTAPLMYLGGNSGNYPGGAAADTEAERRALKEQDDAIVAERGFNRKNMRVGNSEARNYGGFVNAAYRLGGNLEAYVSGGVTHRTGKAAGFYRLPNQPTQSDLTIFPDGFLPFINTTINDQSAITGLRANIAGFTADLSNTYGRNELRFDIMNTVNASLPQGPGIRNQTEFYAGTLNFSQNTTNLGFSRKFTNLGSLATLNVAFGGEFRVDNFEISAGELNSYTNGGRLIGTTPTASGAQVFPGYQPSDEVDKDRNNVAGYIDLESDITEDLLVRLAGRAENYSDFGSNVSGQIAARYSFLEGLALRGSFGNGFRAPSLQQRYFTNTSTQFVSGVPNQVLTVNNDNPIVRNSFDDPIQKGFGVEALKQEKSVNYSLGVTARVGRTLTLTVDGYQIDIDDRIVLSSQFVRANPTVNAILGTQPVSRVQFFANAIDTRTRGIDIVANERLTLGENSRLGFTIAANFTETEVRAFNSSSSTINNDPTTGTTNLQNTLFDRQQRTRIESAQPRSKINLAANYGYGIFGIEARLVRFGEVDFRDADPARAELVDQTFDAKWITDLTLSAQVLPQLSIMVGANNLFDVYPDKFRLHPRNNPNNFSVDPATSFNSSLDNTNRNRFVYNANQFGFNGGYYFVRLNVTLPTN
ncbi:collagen-binding protein [Hymenobacter qilianensis]|uniref:TonB-dependent receptor n=2 Tax=Hymenobacter qilianensis TaxID=1385715 RepID=A0A7H0GR54_9BACT|nr:TonB-dependent receptor [Hymenobacter qilianensis]QNP50770.1 TonB-dependent receptor [Hymenobacter qilianensis]GGF50860.1 collagen-binding protein [Hymenobacter qilianensis]